MYNSFTLLDFINSRILEKHILFKDFCLKDLYFNTATSNQYLESYYNKRQECLEANDLINQA